MHDLWVILHRLGIISAVFYIGEYLDLLPARYLRCNPAFFLHKDAQVVSSNQSYELLFAVYDGKTVEFMISETV